MKLIETPRNKSPRQGKKVKVVAAFGHRGMRCQRSQRLSGQRNEGGGHLLSLAAFSFPFIVFRRFGLVSIESSSDLHVSCFVSQIVHPGKFIILFVKIILWVYVPFDTTSLEAFRMYGRIDYKYCLLASLNCLIYAALYSHYFLIQKRID